MKKIIANFILAYLRTLARWQLKKNPQAVIIGITGSAGKTSTRLALVRILKTKGQVKHSAHANSESGIPLNILSIKPFNYSPLDWLRMILLAPLMLLFNWEKFNYYVVEMGIDSPLPPKNMNYLLSILKPHVGIILNAGLVHGAAFDYLVKDRDPARRAEKIKAEIAKEKMRLAYGIDPAGVAVVNTDQPALKALAKNVKCRLITYGTKQGSRLKIVSIKNRRDFTLQFLYQSQMYTLKLTGLFETSYASTFAAAIAAAAGLGISPARSLEALQGFTAPSGRLRLFAGINKSHLIDSSYNASPETVSAALKLLKQTAGRAYKLAVLGDMRELGLQAKPAHKALADWVRKYADECVLFGGLTGEFTYPVLQRAGFPVHHFDDIDSLNRYLAAHVKTNSWILVKGSQNTILLERAVEKLLADPRDIVHLARRGKYWDRVRSATD